MFDATLNSFVKFRSNPSTHPGVILFQEICRYNYSCRDISCSFHPIRFKFRTELLKKVLKDCTKFHSYSFSNTAVIRPETRRFSKDRR